MLRSNHFLALAAILLATGCSKSESPEEPVSASAEETNPFFVDSTLPYGMPHFDLIRDEHFVPAFERGMAEHMAEIETIASNPEPATFENTIVAMERAGQMLGRARMTFGNLNGTITNDTKKEIQKLMAPRFSAHDDSIRLNTKLFARISSLHESRESLGLDAESLNVLERYHTDFVRAGARLSEEEKAQLREINSEIAELQTAFRQNVLDEVNDSAVVVDSRDELTGLSDSRIESAAAEAKKRGLDGKYVLTLRNTSQQPPLVSLQNRELRQRIQEVSEVRGSRGNEWDTRAIVARVFTLRAERAAMLGYENHAHYTLEDRTAKTIEAVNDMLGKLAPRAVSNANKEAADLQALVNETEETPFELASWDWLYYTEMLRQKRYSFDADLLKPYFEINRVLEEGVFFMAEHLYGLTFEERPELPKYHEDTRIFEVFFDGEPHGIFIFDPYARDSKRGGAWKNSYVRQSHLLNERPVVANHLNVTKPPEGEPTLLTFGEVTTMFHEFGHAVHGLFSNVKFPRFADTRVPRDFVEFPSQVHEMWATWPEVLANYAVHDQTGEPIPQDLLDRVIESQIFNEGFKTTEYLAASIVDQAWHQVTPDELPPAEAVMEFEQKVLADWGIDFAPVPPRYRTPYFSHIMGGYSAGYYSYIWSEVLDADTVEWFKENGGLKRENGDHFRETLLSRGGSLDAMDMYRNFAGRDPSIEPLLKRRGLN